MPIGTVGYTPLFSSEELKKIRQSPSKGTALADKLDMAQSQVGDLVGSVMRLEGIIDKLEKLTTGVSYSYSDRAVRVRSGQMGLNYGAGEATKPLKDVAAFAGVQSGNITINGVQIAIDKDVDTLADVAARINASNAGVRVAVDEANDKFSIVSKTPYRKVQLSDSIGFFEAVKVDEKAHAPSYREDVVFTDPLAAQKLIKSMGEEFSKIFNDSYDGLDADTLKDMRSKFKGAIKEIFANNGGTKFGDVLRSGLGVGVSFSESSDKKLDFRFKPADFAKALEENFSQVRSFVAGFTQKTASNDTQSISQVITEIRMTTVLEIEAKITESAKLDIGA